MKHHPDLFNARSMHNDTRLLFQLKLLLGTVCAYGGEIPISNSDLAKRLKTSTYRVKVLLQKLVCEGVVRYDDRGKLFLTSFKFIQDKDISKEDLYAKNFAFFNSEEFLNEERMVQRFVLHYVGNQLVHIPGNPKWGHLDDLYGSVGLLNIRTPKEALQVIEKASKYLSIQVFKRSFRVLHVHKKWLDMGEVYSEGAELWVMKQLKKHRFCCDFISRKVVWQFAKVMEDYYSKFELDYEKSTGIFDLALYNIQKNKMRSNNFFKMIYKDEEELIINDEKNELDEISAYFRAVMEEAEYNYAVQLSMNLETINIKKQAAESNLYVNDELSEINHALLEEANEQYETVWKKLQDLNQRWLKRFRKNPAWFVSNYHRIISLPAPILEIKTEIQKYIAASTTKLPKWEI